MDANIFVLLERDGSDTHFHGCVAIPKGKDESDVARIYSAVMDTGDEWNYDDIHEALSKEGFTRIPARQFWEDQAIR